jgi:hypothetical protein
VDVSSVFDGNSTFIGGHNEVENLFQQKTSFDKGVNVMLNGNGLIPRAGKRELKIQVLDPEFEKLFLGGKLQAFIPLSNGKTALEIYSGVIFKVNYENLQAYRIRIGDSKTDRVSATLSRINWSYAGDFVVIFDYPNLPVIYQQVSNVARRSNLQNTEFVIDPNNLNGPLVEVSSPEIPPSEIGAFNSDRLFVGEGVTFTGGDPISYTTPEAPITFKEVLTANAPFVDEFFQVGNSTPFEYLTAMGYLKIAETTTGFGPLLLSTNKNIYAAGVSKPRDSWTTDGPLIKLALPNVSIAGQRAFTNVNNDVFFTDSMGELRSFGVDVDNQKKWDDGSISRAIKSLIGSGDPSLYKFSVVEYWDSKLFFFVCPQRMESIKESGKPIMDYCFKGLAVLDFAPNATFGQENPPAFLGLWTSIDFTEMGVIGTDLIIKGRAGSRNVSLRLEKGLKYDIFNGKAHPIRSRVYLNRYGFNSRLNEKELRSISMDITNIQGEFELEVKYKPSSIEKYSLYKKVCYNAPICRKSLGKPALSPHAFNNLKLGNAEEVSCNPSTESLVSRFKELDIRLDFRGAWELRSISLRGEAKIEISEATVGCLTKEGKEIELPCHEPTDFEFYGINDGEYSVDG